MEGEGEEVEKTLRYWENMEEKLQNIKSKNWSILGS